MDTDLVLDLGHRGETVEVATPTTFLVKTGTTGEMRGELLARTAHVSPLFSLCVCALLVVRSFLARKFLGKVLSLICLAKRILMFTVSRKSFYESQHKVLYLTRVIFLQCPGQPGTIRRRADRRRRVPTSDCFPR